MKIDVHRIWRASGKLENSLFVALTAMGLLLPGANAQTEEAEAPMNVLFIVSDDLNMDVGAFGSERVVTPNLDRLARDGMRFQRAFCQYPVCGPSRNSFLSGLSPETIGFPEQGGFTQLRDFVPDVTTLPQLFRENGYYTANIGKIFHISLWDPVFPTEDTWKLGDAASWDYRYNAKPAGMGPNSSPPFDTKGEKHYLPGVDGGIGYWSESPESDLSQIDGQATQQAILQLDQLRRNGKPFFLAVGYRRPHLPFTAPTAYFWPYPLKNMVLPDPGDRSDTPAAAFNTHPVNEGVPDEMLPFMRAYFASVSFLDAQVGRLLDRLEEVGLKEKTIIVFISDHGYQLGEHGNWHKFTLFDESARVPVIIRVPGMTTPGSETYEVVELTDLYPTLRELCNLPAPNQELEGRSLVPLLQNPAADFPDRPAFTQVQRGKVAGEEMDPPLMGYSVRTADFRYNEWWTRSDKPALKGVELYHLESDPAEEINLAEDPAHAEKREELSGLLAEYRGRGR